MGKLGRRARVAGGTLLLALSAALVWERARNALPGAWAGGARAGEKQGAADPGGSGRMMRGTVRGHGVDTWTLRFTRRAHAEVRVESASGAGLDCAVHDAVGNTLGQVVVRPGLCLVRWEPPRTGTYRVLIRNAASAPHPYRLVTD